MKNAKGQFTKEVYKTKLMARREGFVKGFCRGAWFGFCLGSTGIFFSALLILSV